MSGLGIDKTRARNQRPHRALDASTDAGVWAGVASGGVVWWTTHSLAYGVAAALCSTAIGLSLGYLRFRQAKSNLATSR